MRETNHAVIIAGEKLSSSCRNASLPCSDPTARAVPRQEFVISAVKSAARSGASLFPTIAVGDARDGTLKIDVHALEGTEDLAAKS
ncbi:hypothetical protein [Aureimonas endophytica]|uniref:hypothetical protein n=1 Tax=Aureimonas endophytica TaxID=2027858 RepID=UPI00166B31B4|nr:hypothetical protein [Aureimonas endophytica]